MLRLSKKADYALMAMRHLATDGAGGNASARSIAEAYGIPLEMMAKILQRLFRKGLLRSERGIKGGYHLDREPESISVLEVIEAIDGPMALTACSATDHRCAQFRRCCARDPLWQIRDRISDALQSYSLLDFALQSEVQALSARRARASFRRKG
jgi:FeS assembly SUF system regulator